MHDQLFPTNEAEVAERCRRHLSSDVDKGCSKADFVCTDESALFCSLASESHTHIRSVRLNNGHHAERGHRLDVTLIEFFLGKYGLADMSRDKYMFLFPFFDSRYGCKKIDRMTIAI